MGLREDVKFQLKQEWHPRVPDEGTIMQQVKSSLKHGKSSGSMALDRKVIKEENER